jgi:histone acetyltransferase
MEWYIHPSVDFTRIPDLIQAQGEFIMERIRLKAKSHIRSYEPLPINFRPSLEGVS